MFKELNTLELFFESPIREFNVREMARLLKISPATASSELKKMAAKGILVKRKERILGDKTVGGRPRGPPPPSPWPILFRDIGPGEVRPIGGYCSRAGL